MPAAACDFPLVADLTFSAPAENSQDAPLPPWRPTKLTPETFARIVDLVTASETVDDICKDVGIDRVTFYCWQRDNRAFSHAVARAREVAAHAYADKAAAMGQAAFDDPGERGERARGAAVAVAAFQWQAERRNAAAYGQRSAVAIDARLTVGGAVMLSVAEVAAEMEAVKAAALASANVPAVAAAPASEPAK